MKKPDKLTNLVSVGPSIARDLEDLGITEVEQLIGRDAGELFEELQRLKGGPVDRCCEDVFRAAIAQAENPDLPDEQKKWWYWSRVRKGQKP
ncbi:MAG TPA: helix-hairpin-helix domain-containing protein [candidate division Zixibacteria bacterium]|nr:helix-hairpin-helix domain-containing protein [candidate division Zixibacteria bacterium]